jgi:hypothetical protein
MGKSPDDEIRHTSCRLSVHAPITCPRALICLMVLHSALAQLPRSAQLPAAPATSFLTKA